MRKAVPLFLAILFYQSKFSLAKPPSPPLPVLPVPSSSQLKWQRREIIMFFHFGVNTFTNSEWGTGHESPTIFNPTALNTTQWISAASALGVSLVILTAKHHDGFCLWPSRYTHHSVALSPWHGGKGDVIRNFVTAAHAGGIDVGLYLSPWDRHEKSYGLEVPYNEYYLGQLYELLTNYGSISEIWFDGAKGANATNMTYYFKDWFGMTKQLQGSINIFSDAGPDLRWVGDEKGSAGETCWSQINRTSLRIGDASLERYLNTGDPRGTDWVPPECDVSIRPGWFWHESEKPKPLNQLIDIYYKSVGRNCVLLLNVPPNTTGLVSEIDVKRLRQFRSAIDKIFKEDIARGSVVKASSERGGEHGGFAASNVVDGDEETYWTPEENKKGSYWIELRGLNQTAKFNVVRIQEMIRMGQRIGRYEVYVDGKAIVRNGTTVGHKRLHRLERPMTAESVRIRITESRGPPLLAVVGLHFDPFKPWVSTDTL
ncbi:alpha-L-fucosidase 1 [Dendrobium catenatum]|uniref:alpha-L-fucosidase n=1 Tax=Dendrobium catenatum TaxID=906689 RepID=A0A2I0VMM2_9ASPA|nr:alpha-L-fucosidase 1 [Dendrobium catenatum]PKU64665.1 Alpha-L-fucosidase 1 [Dendrobium catenatum]